MCRAGVSSENFVQNCHAIESKKILYLSTKIRTWTQKSERNIAHTHNLENVCVQKKDVHMAVLKEMEIYKAEHKAVSTFYAIERRKEGGSMTVHEVEKVVKRIPWNRTVPLADSTLRCRSEH